MIDFPKARVKLVRLMPLAYANPIFGAREPLRAPHGGEPYWQGSPVVIFRTLAAPGSIPTGTAPDAAARIPNLRNRSAIANPPTGELLHYVCRSAPHRVAPDIDGNGLEYAMPPRGTALNGVGGHRKLTLFGQNN